MWRKQKRNNFLGIKNEITVILFFSSVIRLLAQQVKRNPERFPEDFMFEITKEEKVQLVTNCDRLRNLKHSSVNSMVFTEQGVVPIIDYKKQEQIAELVEESFILKAESECLLEVAKKAVEMVIEDNEEKALEFIKNNA